MKIINRIEHFLRSVPQKVKSFFGSYKYTLSLVLIGLFFADILSILRELRDDSSAFLLDRDARSKGELLKLMGATLGGVLVLWGLWINNRRVKEQTRQNEISEKAQINTRFKDASILLGSKDTSSRLAGIYALHQIAMEIHKDGTQVGFVKVIHDVLCSFVREYFKLEKDETKTEIGFGMLNTANDTPQYVVPATPTIVLQTIVDVLFNNEGNIYKDFSSDLSDCYIKDVHFLSSRIDNARFDKSILVDVGFEKAKLSNVFLWKAELSKVFLWEAKLSNVEFWGATLSSVSFPSAELSNVRFGEAKLSGVEFGEAELSDVDFANTKLT